MHSSQYAWALTTRLAVTVERWGMMQSNERWWGGRVSTRARLGLWPGLQGLRPNFQSAVGSLVTTGSQDLGLTSHPKDCALPQDRVPISVLKHSGYYIGQRDEHPLLALQNLSQYRLASLGSIETSSARQIQIKEMGASCSRMFTSRLLLPYCWMAVSSQWCRIIGREKMCCFGLSSKETEMYTRL